MSLSSTAAPVVTVVALSKWSFAASRCTSTDALPSFSMDAFPGSRVTICAVWSLTKTERRAFRTSPSLL